MSDEPTADELAAAQAVLARKAAADQAKVDAVRPAIELLVRGAHFGAVLDQAMALYERLPADSVFAAHLTAVVTGMTNLRNDIAATRA